MRFLDKKQFLLFMSSDYDRVGDDETFHKDFFTFDEAKRYIIKKQFQQTTKCPSFSSIKDAQNYITKIGLEHPGWADYWSIVDNKTNNYIAHG